MSRDQSLSALTDLVTGAAECQYEMVRLAVGHRRGSVTAEAVRAATEKAIEAQSRLVDAVREFADVDRDPV